MNKSEETRPILLLRWLEEPTSEIRDALNVPDAATAIRWADVATRQELPFSYVLKRICGNPYAQFLYIGCHGDREALFRSDKAPYSDRLTYSELASHLKELAQGNKEHEREDISVWLGACDSAAAAAAWSNTGVPVRYLLGFAQKVKEKLVIELLPKLVSMTWDPALPFDEEIDAVRALLGIEHVQAFYRVEDRFIDIDRFELIYGMDLQAYFESKQQHSEEA